MKSPRVRFTVRRMMVAVAVLSLLFGVASNLRRSALRHLDLAIAHTEASVAWQSDPPRAVHHARLAQRHALAARRPWISVESDSPGPR